MESPNGLLHLYYGDGKGKTTAAMGLAVFILRELLPLNRLCTLVEIAVGVAVYAGVALLVKAVTPEDFRAFRGKRK